MALVVATDRSSPLPSLASESTCDTLSLDHTDTDSSQCSTDSGEVLEDSSLLEMAFFDDDSDDASPYYKNPGSVDDMWPLHTTASYEGPLMRQMNRFYETQHSNAECVFLQRSRPRQMLTEHRIISL